MGHRKGCWTGSGIQVNAGFNVADKGQVMFNMKDRKLLAQRKPR